MCPGRIEPGLVRERRVCRVEAVDRRDILLVSEAEIAKIKKDYGVLARATARVFAMER